MTKGSHWSWKQDAPWSDRICAVCKEPIVLSHGRGTFGSATRQFVRHLDCGPTVVCFVHDGDEAGLILEAAVRDYEEARRAA